MLAEYSTINRTYWQRLERGEITKQAVLEGRFQEFFSLHGLDPALAVPFNAAYQRNLGDTVCFYPYALEAVQALRSHVLQFAATNGHQDRPGPEAGPLRAGRAAGRYPDLRGDRQQRSRIRHFLPPPRPCCRIVPLIRS